MSLDRYWYSRNAMSLALWPLSQLFGVITALRRWCYRLGLLRTHRFDVPVIVVGNISVGGTGKTPLVIWLARYLREQGFKPGIVSRGYGGKAANWPQQVRPDSDPVVVGDEPVLLARRTGCPLTVGPDRPAAVRALLAHRDCDIVISDDGLQHYALGRSLEIVVLDGERGIGNGWLLPAGPLRERPARLAQVDLVIANGGAEDVSGFRMQLAQPQVASLSDAETVQPLVDWRGRRVHAVAGIGYPERFFRMLEGVGLQIERHHFPDHHAFIAGDLVFADDAPVLMTEKDAVKCSRLPKRERYWAVRVEAQPDAGFVEKLNELIKGLKRG